MLPGSWFLVGGCKCLILFNTVQVIFYLCVLFLVECYKFGCFVFVFVFAFAFADVVLACELGCFC